MLEVAGHALLVGVEQQEEDRIDLGLRAGGSAPLLAAPRLLDLDDLRAHPGKAFGAGRARLELRQIDDPDAFERGLAARVALRSARSAFSGFDPHDASSA
jgi:hypothetical protein